MQRPDATWRTAALAAVIALLLWLPTGSHAMATTGRHGADQVTANVQASNSAPELMEPCVPCLSCPAAPSPAAQSFDHPEGESGAGQWLQQSAAHGSAACAQPAGEPVAVLPLRVAYCRWLN